MCSQLHVEHSLGLGVAVETVATIFHLYGLQLFAGNEVAQLVDLGVDDKTEAYEFVVEVLDDHGLVVIGEERHLRWPFDVCTTSLLMARRMMLRAGAG